MATIYEEMHSINPAIEMTKREHILNVYAYNKGTGEKKETKYFSMLWEAFAWAAVLGFVHGKRKPLEGKFDRPFEYSQIYNNGNDIFYSLILFVVAKEGYEILRDAKEVNKVIEEYANGGFEVIFTILRDKGNDYFGDDSNFLQEVLDRKSHIKMDEVLMKDMEDKKDEKIDDGESFNFM
ncbi:hypothetical protein [uncultured Draconibacterium sp.]|uniref:hypothetical protein n=1 Tax=uncultured Draconibacterium sp. TaxID=1573823 RepID=UPI002AA9360D|nr:hypothetical protein [uncultured Draconibacterium sp.]